MVRAGMRSRFRRSFAAVTGAVIAIGAIVDCGDDDVALRPDAGATADSAPNSDAVSDALEIDGSDPPPAPCFLPSTPPPSGSLDSTFGTASGLGGYARARIPFGAPAIPHD